MCLEICLITRQEQTAGQTKGQIDIWTKDRQTDGRTDGEN